MNIIKHMETTFIVTLACAGLVAFTADSSTPAQARAATPAATPALVAIQSGIPVVHVSAKRLTAAEKLQSLALERSHKRA